MSTYLNHWLRHECADDEFAPSSIVTETCEHALRQLDAMGGERGGFAVVETGGGCDAWMVQTPTMRRAGIYLLITDSDANVPEWDHDEAWAGAYRDGHECADPLHWRAFADAAELFAEIRAGFPHFANLTERDV